ncbi:phosphoribosylglycinamide formyltransferase [Clostridium perfringens]|uniref:phosphoribosylglycinamide formyltransferase n=1 Tax=Clostridium perfringens TaxID=1502 RepID=UPI0028E10643|nr:phosphoribosylglycinamide formyltransferase [Clostridium perfringens]MDT9335377.1 phosphoribosylglycinamide formyltransferase [Clostridium perfringens]MDT9343134.1 phosphoribosylglycinamide formyltransferase [Clostridium perfringens]MDT9346315.1 phosphoribosylglycinamide formyltransferase [Clostridium perfringens]MDT9352220.1 phosphoribosylglycinamide formyltransferase [Clostridium perfringens]
MYKIAVLASGSGSNLQSILDNIKNENIKGEVSLVIGSKEGIFALERAEKNGIKTSVVSKKEFGDKTSDEILRLAKENNIDLIVLAGYLSILKGKLLEEYGNRIINIHPSLIPSFCGNKMYGINVHKAAIEKGVKFSGCTVHFVNDEVDGGAIIAQEIVEVNFEDTPESLQKKVLEKEHILLPRIVKYLCEEKIEIYNGKVKILN